MTKEYDKIDSQYCSGKGWFLYKPYEGEFVNTKHNN